jgi:hypothetical protein
MIKRFMIALLATLVIGCAQKVTKAPAPVALTPEQMQQNMMQAGAVRPEHALLKKMVGEWKAETKLWMDPTKEPEVSKGTATGKLIYGGRYLVQNYKGKFMNQPFEGTMTMGFDNMKERYFTTWIDSMITSVMQSEGSQSSDSTITLASSMTCPMTNELMNGEEVVTFIDNKNYRFESYQNKDGQKVKMMEINYKRVK